MIISRPPLSAVVCALYGVGWAALTYEVASGRVRVMQHTVHAYQLPPSWFLPGLCVAAKFLAFWDGAF